MQRRAEGAGSPPIIDLCRSLPHWRGVVAAMAFLSRCGGEGEGRPAVFPLFLAGHGGGGRGSCERRRPHLHLLFEGAVASSLRLVLDTEVVAAKAWVGDPTASCSELGAFLRVPSTASFVVLPDSTAVGRPLPLLRSSKSAFLPPPRSKWLRPRQWCGGRHQQAHRNPGGGARRL
jgi:hypothetical protein